MSGERTTFTAVFETDIAKFDGNPFHQDTPFGRPCATGIGNAFNAVEALEAERDEVRIILAGTDIASLPHDMPLAAIAEARIKDLRAAYDRSERLVLEGLAEIGRREIAEDALAKAEAEVERMRKALEEIRDEPAIMSEGNSEIAAAALRARSEERP